jgi:transcription elongation factor S-II
MRIRNPDTFRHNIRQEFQKKIGDELLEATAAAQNLKKEQVVNNLEKGIYNFTIQECTIRKLVKKWENPAFVQLYVDKVRSVFSNIDSRTVQESLKSAECAPQQLAFMTHQEFEPEKWHPLIERKTKRDASKFDHRVGASTAMFTCSRCQSKNCTYYEMQTRSADEPATIFITCLNCDKHWRI